jgi:LuxR family maltose regulon positive regulatory protein
MAARRTHSCALLRARLDLASGRFDAVRARLGRASLAMMRDRLAGELLLPSHLTNAEIARECLMSVNTVKTHLKSIYAKLGVSTRASTVERARLLGLL